MRAALLASVLVLAPLALAATAADPAGDVTASHFVAFGPTSPSPYAECTHDAADLVHVSVTNAGGQMKAGLTVADRLAAAVCPVPFASTTDERLFVLMMSQDDMQRQEAGVRFTWRESDGATFLDPQLLFRDGKRGACVSGSLLADGDALVLTCPLVGTVALQTGGTRAYDLRGLTWEVHAMTHHIAGTPASYVFFDDVAGPLVATT